MLIITNLHVNTTVDPENKILKGLEITINQGEIHALMGPNGSGKSTLAQTLMGNPQYSISQGSITIDGCDLLKMSPQQRAGAGIFLSFQHPSEIQGVPVSNYLRMIYNKSHQTTLSPVAFRKILKDKLALLNMNENVLERYLNEGFSGGEKKKMEMLQMLVLEPKLVILDEVDSGLDIDALKIVSEAVNYLHQKNNTSILLITHYARILNHVTPEFVHVMQDGVIIESGTKDLAYALEKKGYSHDEK